MKPHPMTSRHRMSPGPKSPYQSIHPVLSQFHVRIVPPNPGPSPSIHRMKRIHPMKPHPMTSHHRMSPRPKSPYQSIHPVLSQFHVRIVPPNPGPSPSIHRMKRIHPMKPHPMTSRHRMSPGPGSPNRLLLLKFAKKYTPDNHPVKPVS
jgi:hypothetical protein